MKKTLLIIALFMIAICVITSCATVNLNSLNANCKDVIIKRDPMMTFHDLKYGLETHVITTTPNSQSTGDLYHLSENSFFIAPTVNYVRSMGLTESSPSTDYYLYITINKADIVSLYTANVEISVSLKDSKDKEVYSQKGISISKTGIYNDDSRRRKYPFYVYNLVLDEAYTSALEQINWNRIASFLRTEQLAKDEPQKQVQGFGDTALEQTIVRWDVQSRPQGADIFWRVVSKTPEVKSTNNKYLQTTPYEATKALDIRGLTYQVSSNVCIILRCEKDGYMSQEKEFDVRMVLDQEEISAFFRLVKEE